MMWVSKRNVIKSFNYNFLAAITTTKTQIDMSISRPSEHLTRPVKKYVKFKGGEDDGFFSWWEKYDIKDERYTADTRGEEHQIDMGQFVVVDCDLLTVTGYTDRRGNLWSNEVRSIDDQLNVRYHGDKKPVATGDWSYIKDEVPDAKFTKSVYLITEDGECINLHLSGASLTSWFNDIEGNKQNLGKYKVRVKEIQSGKKGNVKYKFPIFEYGDPISEKELNRAMKFDEEVLQPYLDKYLEGGSSKNSGESNDRVDDSAVDLSNWRDYKCREGTLGLMPMSLIATLKTTIEETGGVETEEYNFVSQALLDYNDAKKSWADKKGKSGRLGDMSIDELQSLFEKIMEKDPRHASRLFVEAGLQQRIAEQPEEEVEDDDIPF